MLYAISDIHGYLLPLKKALEKVALGGGDRLVFLGDYIDYGPESGQVLRLIYDLQRRHGAGKVIVLRGNHEEMLLEWLDAYGSPRAEGPDGYGLLSWSDWLNTDPGPVPQGHRRGPCGNGEPGRRPGVPRRLF